VLPFSGIPIDWPVWSVKFLSRAESKGYLDLLSGGEVSLTDSENPSSNATDDEITTFNNLRQANKQGFIDLVLSVDGTTKDGRIAFSIVKGCRNGDKKPGDVALAWERLNKNYEPKTAPSRINLKRIFTSMKTGTKDDPDEWLTSLEDMREQLINAGSTMMEDELLEHVSANLPKDYEVVANP
jgi:gag-polypeptide of LTR copia-type